MAHKNLEQFNVTTRALKMSPEELLEFFNTFVGAISTEVSVNRFERCLLTATENLIDRRREKKSNER